jgi:hypothetical protein
MYAKGLDCSVNAQKRSGKLMRAVFTTPAVGFLGADSAWIIVVHPRTRTQVTESAPRFTIGLHRFTYPPTGLLELIS